MIIINKKIQNHLNLILYYQSNYLDRTWREKMNEIKNLDVNNFDNEISQSNKLVLVDFGLNGVHHAKHSPQY